MLTKVNGLILKSEDCFECDKQLVVLTAELGKIYVLAKRAVGVDGSLRIGVMPLFYAELVLYEKNDRYWLREATVIESFPHISRELDRLALSQFIVELAEKTSYIGQNRAAMLSLTLNALYLLSETDKPVEHIRAVAELRTALIEGYTPELDGCIICGAAPEPDSATIDVMGGGLICRTCLHRGEENKKIISADADELREATVIIPLTDTALSAMRYVFAAPPKKAFSFSISGDDMYSLGKAAELYLFNHLDESFPSLNFYKDTLKI